MLKEAVFCLRKRKNCTVLLFVLYCSRCYSQNFKCHEALGQFLTIAPELYKEKRVNSLDSLISQFEKRCGKNEYSIRLSHLLTIEKDTFNEIDFDSDDYHAVMGYVEDYLFSSLMDSVHESPERLYNLYYKEPELVFEFNRFTQELASQVLAKNQIRMLDGCQLKKTILYAYSNNLRAFRAIITNRNCLNRISKVYQWQVESTLRKPLVDAGLIIGYWIPYGNNELFGHHPSIGFLFGFGKKRMIYDLAMEFRFGSPNREYQIQYNGVSTSTNHYFGGYFGLDVAYELVSLDKRKFCFLGGVALDGFDAVKGSKTMNGKSFFSLNMNMGVGCRWFARDGSFLGVEMRHNFNNYDNRGGTDLSGNSVTGRFIIGLLKNDRRKRHLDYLKRIGTR